MLYGGDKVPFGGKCVLYFIHTSVPYTNNYTVYHTLKDGENPKKHYIGSSSTAFRTLFYSTNVFTVCFVSNES